MMMNFSGYSSKYQSAYILAKYGRDDALSILADGVESKDKYEKVVATRFLARLGDKRVIESLIELRNDHLDDDWDLLLWDFFAGNIHAVQALCNQISPYSGDDEWILIVDLDEEGEHLTKTLFPLLAHKREAVRKKASEVIIENYVLNIDLDTMAHLEENYHSNEAYDVLRVWLQSDHNE